MTLTVDQARKNWDLAFYGGATADQTFPGILPSHYPKASAALLVVAGLCPDLTEARQTAVAARIALKDAPGRTMAEAVEIAANDAVWGSLGARFDATLEQTKRDVLRFADALKASAPVEPIPVLEPITATVAQLNPALWSGLHTQDAEQAA